MKKFKAFVFLLVPALLCLASCSSEAVLNSPYIFAALNVPDEIANSESSSAEPLVPAEEKSSDEIIAELFEKKESDVQVTGVGIVSRILADDNDGSRHQRFILELGSGQTLLMTHNIDIAPRLDGLDVGDKVEFYGEYFYNEQGGGVHWTHHDPDKKHIDGWLKWCFE